MASWNGNNNGGGKGGNMMMILLVVVACCCLLSSSSGALVAFNESVRSALGFGGDDPPSDVLADPADTSEPTISTDGGGWVCPYPWTGYRYKQDVNGLAVCCKDKDNVNRCSKSHRPLQIAGDQLTADLIMKKMEQANGTNPLYVDAKTNNVIWREACPCPVGNTTETLNFVEKKNGQPYKMYCMDQNVGGEFAVCNPKCTKGEGADGKHQYVDAKITSLTQCGDYDLTWRRW